MILRYLKNQKNEMNNIVGIDLGVKTLVTTSDYEYYGNPRHLTKYEKKTKREQRNLLRKIKGSNNYNLSNALFKSNTLHLNEQLSTSLKNGYSFFKSGIILHISKLVRLFSSFFKESILLYSNLLHPNVL